jgi:xylulokinase
VNFVGVDLGTSGIKAGIVDEDGNLLVSSYWNTTITSSRPGQMQQSIDDLLLSALKIVREVVERSRVDPASVEGIALSGQMGGIIGIDERFEPVTGLDMNLDLRSEKYSVYLHERLGEKLTGITCGSPLNGQKILWWKEENREVYERIAKFVTLNGYVGGKIANLKGEQAFVDCTLLAFFGLEDARTLRWSGDVCAELSIDQNRLPMIVSPWWKIGGLSGAASEASGLRAGTPLFAGAGDQPAGFLGAGFIQPGSVFDVSSSTTLISQCVEEFTPDLANRSVMYMPSVKPGVYNAFIYLNGGGITLNWFADEIMGGSAEGGKQRDKYETITEEARSVPPGSEGLIFIPYLGGRQSPFDVKLRGGWLGLNWGHKRKHLYRAMLESIAYEYRLGLGYMRRLYPQGRPGKVTVTGGGSRNTLWNQIKADVCGLPYERLDGYDFAIRGCCMIAAYGSEVYGDLDTAADRMKRVRKAERYTPSARDHELYERHFSTYRSALEVSLRATLHLLTDGVAGDGGS